MSNVVKLILICQIKDDNIPQLMPLIWLNSIGICFLIFIILINIYIIKIEYILVESSYNRDEKIIKLIW